MQDDSGSYAIFTEQGSSASQMTAAKVLDVIARLPGCARQASDAVFAYAPVNMEDATKLLKNSKYQCLIFRYVSHSAVDTRMAKH